MTYKEFVGKWLGKGINYDNFAGAQCMDVYRMYVKEVLQCPQSPPVTGAKNVWDTYLPEYFDRIPNSPTGVPEQGDVVIWSVGTYGHIAICDHATTSTLSCFEQNWVEQDGSGVTEIRLHGNYNNVLGWLHFKENMTNDQQKALEILEQFKTEFNHGNLEGAISAAIGAAKDIPVKDEQIQTLQAKVLSLDKFVHDLQDRVVALESELTANLALVADWQKKYESANKSLDNANKSNIELVAQKNQYKNWYEAKCDELKKLDKMTAWQHIRYGIKLLTIKK